LFNCLIVSALRVFFVNLCVWIFSATDFNPLDYLWQSRHEMQSSFWFKKKNP